MVSVLSPADGGDGSGGGGNGDRHHTHTHTHTILQQFYLWDGMERDC